MKHPLLDTMAIALLVLCMSCKSQVPIAISEKSKAPKNVILLIGDGMGLSQVSSSFYFGNTNPNFERFKHIGLIKTSSQNGLITDSAAGATAFSAGIKTYNGAIGVDSDTLAVELLTEIAAKKLISTGVVSTSSVTHATPASFYAHVRYRSQEEEIAAQLPLSSIHFIAGAGTDYFFKRKDHINLGALFSNQGFILDTMALNRPENFSLEHKFAYLLSPDHMPKMSEGRGQFLSKATQLGLEYLSQNKNGFFLMVEGSQIDWGGHNNDSSYIIEEVRDFDRVIGEVLDYAKKEGNTLVIVTADHETGGYTLASDKGNYNKIKGSFSTTGHSATLIPVFAFGPGSENFQGIYENNAIFHKIQNSVNWK